LLLLASFQTLLHRYSGQADIRVGVPVANRNRVETEGLIGFFVNTQVLKAEFDGQQTFRSLLQQVKSRAGCPGASGPAVRATGRCAATGAQPEPQPAVPGDVQPPEPGASGAGRHRLPKLAIEGLPWASSTAQFDLTLNTFESSDNVWAELTYATDLFDVETIERLAQHWPICCKASSPTALSALPNCRCMTPPNTRRPCSSGTRPSAISERAVPASGSNNKPPAPCKRLP
jgi:non-ribosomal peptide synthetase component F